MEQSCNMGQTLKLKWKINEHEVLEQLEQSPKTTGVRIM